MIKFPIRRIILLFVCLGPLFLGAEVQLTILHTTDIHAHLADHVSSENGGDWLRLATLLRRERAEAGPGNMLLIDTGDTIQGTLVGTLSQGAVALPVLAALEVDAWVIGNHELDFGLQRLRELTKLVQVPVLAGNLTLENGRPLPAYRICEKGGARIAIIGMTSGYLHNWFTGPDYDGFTVEDATLAIERIMPEVMRHKPDMIVLGIHQGFQYRDTRGVNEVRSIAYRFPQIDLILGAHTHQQYGGQRIGGSWYVQPAEHAAEYARIQVRIDIRRKKVLDISSTLVKVPGDTPRDPLAEEAAAAWLQVADREAIRTIATPARAVTSKGTPGIDCQISDMVCRAMMKQTGAVAALHGVLARLYWPAGKPVTRGDLFRAMPYENKVCVVNLTRLELADVIGEQLALRQAYTYNGIHGVHVVADRESGRVINVTPAHGVWPEDERRPVAITSYNAAGGGGRYPRLRELCARPESGLQVEPSDAREIVRRYMEENREWTAPPTRWITWQPGG